MVLPPPSSTARAKYVSDPLTNRVASGVTLVPRGTNSVCVARTPNKPARSRLDLEAGKNTPDTVEPADHVGLLDSPSSARVAACIVNARAYPLTMTTSAAQAPRAHP